MCRHMTLDANTGRVGLRLPLTPYPTTTTVPLCILFISNTYGASLILNILQIAAATVKAEMVCLRAVWMIIRCSDEIQQSLLRQLLVGSALVGSHQTCVAVYSL